MFINTRAKLNQQVVFNLCSQRYILCYRLIKYSIIFESKATSRQSEENPHSAVNTSVWETVTRSSHHQQKAQAGLRTFGDDLNCNPFITAFRTPCQPQSHVTKTAEITDSGALGNTHDTYRFAVGSLFDWDVISLFLSTRHVTLSRKKKESSAHQSTLKLNSDYSADQKGSERVTNSSSHMWRDMAKWAGLLFLLI